MVLDDTDNKERSLTIELALGCLIGRDHVLQAKWSTKRGLEGVLPSVLKGVTATNECPLLIIVIISCGVHDKDGTAIDVVDVTMEKVSDAVDKDVPLV